ncbi:hypothetical protein KFK09_010952 [Dendrobium nobile]|uniref:Secreted protein n=1 Tax=Dendrobium nobile TaxID=94219 RepID=A0A8T3BE90_DENNO|nr:hypothetical protein KFK09_010952 [Dendrobium nobile]
MLFKLLLPLLLLLPVRRVVSVGEAGHVQRLGSYFFIFFSLYYSRSYNHLSLCTCSPSPTRTSLLYSAISSGFRIQASSANACRYCHSLCLSLSLSLSLCEIQHTLLYSGIIHLHSGAEPASILRGQIQYKNN